MAADDRVEVVRLLRSIDSSLKDIARSLVKAAPAEVADDRELDSQYGDPVVKFTPRDWTGDDYRDRRFSECPPDFLEMVANAFDYFAKKAEEADEKTSTGKPVAVYKRKDAARARGWAKRKREQGWKPTEPKFTDDGPDPGWNNGDGFNSEWN